MRRDPFCSFVPPALALLGMLASVTWSQEAAKQSAGSFRDLGNPGAVITITPAVHKDETYSRHDLVDLLAKDANFGERRDGARVLIANLAKNVRRTHDIWAFEFNFKPMRIKQVDVPRPPAGKFDRKNIWYMVYSVRNVTNKPAKFQPRFLLFSDRKVKLPNGEVLPKIYADRVIAVAHEPIRQREDPRRTFLDTVAIGKEDIPPGSEPGENEKVGVATWEDVDPQTDYFSVYVQGLSNAYKRELVTEKDKQGNEVKRYKYLRKTLELNFWRPGDDVDETDREIRYGQPNNVEFRWVYK